MNFPLFFPFSVFGDVPLHSSAFPVAVAVQGLQGIAFYHFFLHTAGADNVRKCRPSGKPVKKFYLLGRYSYGYAVFFRLSVRCCWNYFSISSGEGAHHRPMVL